QLGLADRGPDRGVAVGRCGSRHRFAAAPLALRTDAGGLGDRPGRPAGLAQGLEEPRPLGWFPCVGHGQHPMQVAELPPRACPVGPSAGGLPCVATALGPLLAFCWVEALVFAAWMPAVEPLPPCTTLPEPGAVPPPPLPAFGVLLAVVAVVLVGVAAAA